MATPNTHDRRDATTLGSGAELWQVGPDHVDMLAGRSAAIPVTLSTQTQSIRFDLSGTALIVVDMQNDFCAEGGLKSVTGSGVDTARRPIEPLRRLLRIVRDTPMRVIWLNWGNRPDRMNLPPNVQHIFNRDGSGPGIGDPLSGDGSAVLTKDSWNAAVVDELEPSADDIRVDKYRISGFWGTPLDSILRNLGTRTVFLAGVNTDQCVLGTMQEASFLGYGCVLLEDCCATSSPEYCTQAALYNAKLCYGFVSDSTALIGALQARNAS